MAKKAVLCSCPWKTNCPYMKLKNWIRPVCSYPDVRTKTELIETVTGKLVEERFAICPFEDKEVCVNEKLQEGKEF